MTQNALMCLALAGTMVLSAQTNPAAPKGSARGARYVEAEPINFNDHSGWTSMFDGSTLKGWDGAPDQWKVENGSITVSSNAEKPLGSMYMYWTGGQPGNFEFKTEIKLEGIAANSGIQFRAKRLGPVVDKKYSQWESRGYQADLDNQNSNTGALIECCAGPRRGIPPRPDRAYRGQVVRTALSPGRKPTLLATIGDPGELAQYYKPGEWNQLHLVVRGTTMMYFINGHLMSVLLDDDPSMFVDRGEICIQLEGSGNNKASFRNLWIKNLP